MLCGRHGEPRSAYFVFTMETVQTALTGSDVHYWFLAGFGDVERLQSSHYAPVDIAIMDAIISLIVQGYFCYRIWTLSRWSWFCSIIAVVCVPDFPTLFNCLTFP